MKTTNDKKVTNLVKAMNRSEKLWFRKWLLDTVETLGLEHKDNCIMNIPHSHSADCDCGSYELEDKIKEILK